MLRSPIGAENREQHRTDGDETREGCEDPRSSRRSLTGVVRTGGGRFAVSIPPFESVYRRPHGDRAQGGGHAQTDERERRRES